MANVLEMPVQVTEESIVGANAQFWEQMLGMRLERVAGSAPEAVRCIGIDHLAGFCDLNGVWEGRIEVRLSPTLALEATAAMLMQAADAVQAEDMLDATREIANMIAGTLKSALPRPCTMTVPTAWVERSDFCIPSRTGDSVTVFFAHSAGQLMIRVWHRETIEDETVLAECA